MEDIEQRIHQALSTVRPYLNADGGDVSFIRLRAGGIVEVQWSGTCVICPMSQLTLRAGVERTIMKAIPEIKRVEAVKS